MFKLRAVDVGKVLFVITVIAVALIAQMPRSFAAGQSQYSISESSTTPEQNSTLTVTIAESQGGGDGGIILSDVIVDYNPAQLTWLNQNSPGANFPNSFRNAGGGGTAEMVVGSQTGPLLGANTVGTMSFTVNAGSGTGSISIDGKSVLSDKNYNNVWDLGTVSQTLTFTTPSQPNPNPNPTPPPSHPPAPTPKPTPKPAPPASATPPTPTANPVINNQTNQIATYSVTIKALDKKKKSLSGVKLTLNRATHTTNVAGLATFSNVPAGNYSVMAVIAGKQTLDNIKVVSNLITSQSQQFQITVNTPASSLWIPYTIIVFCLLAIIGIILFTVRNVRRSRVAHHLPGPGQTPSNTNSLPTQSGQPPNTPQVFTPQHSMMSTDQSEGNDSISLEETADFSNGIEEYGNEEE